MIVVRILKGLYFWIAAFLLTVFFFLSVMFTHWWLVLRGRGQETNILHALCGEWGKSLFYVTPGWRVEVFGKEHIPMTPEALVIVANHESFADIWAVFFLNLQFRWLSKASIFKIPLVGPVMRRTGYVGIKRGDRESHTQAMAASAARLRAGLSMFFFPEGTRSQDGMIKKFKSGAFKLARDEQVRVLPVAIHGARELLPKGSWLPGRAVVKLQVLPPMAAPALDDVHLEQFAEKVRQEIVKAHHQLVVDRSH